MPMIPPSFPLTVKINVPAFWTTTVCTIVVGLLNTTFPVKDFPIREPLGDKVLNILINSIVEYICKSHCHFLVTIIRRFTFK